MMKISNTILAVFQLRNHMSAKAAHKLMANLDYIFYVCDISPSILKSNEAAKEGGNMARTHTLVCPDLDLV